MNEYQDLLIIFLHSILVCIKLGVLYIIFKSLTYSVTPKETKMLIYSWYSVGMILFTILYIGFEFIFFMNFYKMTYMFSYEIVAILDQITLSLLIIINYFKEKIKVI